jgi:hypothetical protein
MILKVEAEAHGAHLQEVAMVVLEEDQLHQT